MPDYRLGHCHKETERDNTHSLSLQKLLPQLKIMISQNYNLERAKIIDNHLCQEGRLLYTNPQKGIVL